MAATNASAIGYEMHAPHEIHGETFPESGTFVVRCSMEGVMAMARVDQQRGVKDDANGNSTVNRKQYEELLRLGIPHEVVSAPASYKPPVVKIQRK